jgi:phospholipase/carboxylesterase
MSQATTLVDLPVRTGDRPRTNPHMPHQQVSQNASAELQEALFERAVALPGVIVGRSHVSVPGARAFHLDASHATGPQEAFMYGTEFAHLHPTYDGSLHIILPEPLALEVIAKGWGEFHPLVAQGVMPPTNLMVFGPRDAAELDTVWRIVQASYDHATGASDPPG